MDRIEVLGGNGAVINTIRASAELAEQLYPGSWRVAAQQDAPMQAQVSRHISVGAFFDRFGALKWDILADTSPQVKAVVQDASVRSYIDLDNADLPAGIALLQAAGHAINAEAVVGAPIRPEELP